MQESLKSFFKCVKCSSQDLEWKSSELLCNSCGASVDIVNGIPRFVEGDYHSNFGLQWNEFSKVQIDSLNGSDESEKRLLLQSNLKPEFFKGKTVLEVGAGCGRFTEILLKFGAKVIALDYSTAIDANKKNNLKDEKQNNLSLFQGDLFNLPLKENSFDIVICYGVIQHTGDNERAINELLKYPKKGGLLLMDIYSNSLRHFNPWTYLVTRPLFFVVKVSEERKLSMVKSFVSTVFPLQYKALNYLKDKNGVLKYIRYLINRSPNSVYGINLHLQGKISKDVAFDWSVLDTFDAWTPKHDHPVSKSQWHRIIEEVTTKNDFTAVEISESGQGHTAVLRKN